MACQHSEDFGGFKLSAIKLGQGGYLKLTGLNLFLYIKAQGGYLG